MEIRRIRPRQSLRDYSNANGCLVCTGPVAGDELICSGGCNDIFNLAGHGPDGYDYDDGTAKTFIDWE